MTIHRMKKRISKIAKPVSVLMTLVFAGLLAGCTQEAQQMADTLAKLQETQQAIVAELPEEDSQFSTDAAPQAETEEMQSVSPAEQSELPTETTDQDVQKESKPAEATDEKQADLPKKGEAYYDLTNVVLYLELYHELPENYITKDEARELGWEGGSVEDYKKGAAIGGDYFGNYEKILPKAGKGGYRECDIDTKGYKNRGSRRLIYTEDGTYYYSSDHYESFRQVLIGDGYSVELSDERMR